MHIGYQMKNLLQEQVAFKYSNINSFLNFYLSFIDKTIKSLMYKIHNKTIKGFNLNGDFMR